MSRPKIGDLYQVTHVIPSGYGITLGVRSAENGDIPRVGHWKTLVERDLIVVIGLSTFYVEVFVPRLTGVWYYPSSDWDRCAKAGVICHSERIK